MDYAHARHAGNAGDVLKHVALMAVLEELLRDPSPLHYLETHAGDGLYPLGSVGEWTAGAGKLGTPIGFSSEVVRSYAKLVQGFSSGGRRAYPGSPLVARSLLRPQDRLVLCELDAQSASVLRRAVPEAQVREADGFGELLSPAPARSLLLIDPPYAQKQEWTDAARAAARLQGSPLLLWYPVKALTRPRALLAELAKQGVHGTAVELHWTPLRLQRDRLNGSGLVFASVPRAAVAAVCAALVDLGPLLQTHGEWDAAQIGF